MFTLSKNDKDTFCKIAQKVNLNKLLPSKVNATNFPIWQKLIEVTGDCIGHFKHQKIFLAVQDRKPCGVLLATANKNQAEELNYYCIKKPLSPFKLSSKIDLKDA